MPPFRYDAPREIFDFTNFVYSPSFVDFGLSLAGKKRAEIDSLAGLPTNTITKLHDGSVYAEGQTSVHQMEWLFGDPIREYSLRQYEHWEKIARCVSTKIALGGTLIHDFRNLRSFRQTSLALYSENALRTGDSNSYRITGEVNDVGAQLTVQAFAVQHHDWYGFDKENHRNLNSLGSIVLLKFKQFGRRKSH